MESGDVPEPLCCDRLNQLILFTGLDIANNPLHSKVFFAFTQKRSADRAPLSIRMLTVNVPIKSKSTTSVKPSKCSKGILKHAWLKKYVDEVPAVMVVFTDLDWDHPSFNEKVTECQSKISSLSFSSRNTRICIVLLQQNCAIGTDDSLSSERAARLCQSCQLPSKQLFVLPITGSIYGYVIRLEAAFHELAQSFYQQRLKQIRARSIPNNFSNLIIRQQFKLAFLSEMRQDTHTALRHYKFAYQQCIDYEHNDNEIYELRYIAGIINYKICYLSFLHGTALEAIAQHSRHVSLFFTASPGIYPSSQLAEIEASMWKSKQCSLFAKLFERAISLGLTAVSTQNPGIYWEAAAVYRIETNQLIEMLDQLIDRHSLTYPEPDPLSPAPVEYIGQRPWRSGVEGGMAADERTETNARIALVLTLKPNHEICLTYLSEARRHYQTHNCARMQRHIMILMATEFSAVGQHGKALQCLSHVLREWHREGFSLSAPTLITKAMIAAFHVANITEFMSMCIQTLNTDAYPSFLSVASHVAANIDLIRRGLPPQAPFPYSSISSDELSVAKELWTRALSERNFFSLEMSRINSFLKARVAFVAPDISVEMGSTFIVMVFLSSHSCISMTFDRLRLSLDEMVATTSSINQNDPAIADRSPLFVFTAENVEVKSNETTQIPFRCILENKKLVDSMKIIVSSLTLELGTVTSTIYGSFEWDWSSLITDQMTVPDADVGAISITFVH
ncbi:hypothetical protein AB6A40_006587 [Gnathostoma spinigerum]|uniref:Trafficking protein particle complex subunit 11 domain-containing protein n=1 Tax=Gnathostoma spinigerum TaxID=75299 RepID=A0ABD6EJ10_9BILA